MTSLITSAGVFGIFAGAAADVCLELDAEVLGLSFGSGLGLEDDLVAFAFGEFGFGDEEVAFLLELYFHFAAWSFSDGGDDFGADGLGFQRGVIHGDADAAVFLDEELGLFATEIEEEAFAGTGFDFGIRKSGRGGEGGDDEEV